MLSLGGTQKTVLRTCPASSYANSQGKPNKCLWMPYPINPNEVGANVYAAHPLVLADQGGSTLPTSYCAERTCWIEVD